MTNKLRCSYCNKDFKYESEKKRHENSHSPRFQCEICNKKFSFISALKRHEKQHQRTGKVECKHCNRSFRDDSLLQRHIKYAHKGIYTCKKCNTEFHSELALSKHVKIHNAKSERKYCCRHNGCEKTFNFPHHLKHHELTHTNSKQHFCEICKKGFIQHHHFKAHMKTHEPEKWLQCTELNCKKKFSTEYSRKRHLLRTHHIKLTDIQTPTELSQCGSDFEDSGKTDIIQYIDFADGGDILLEKENLLKYTETCNEHHKDLSDKDLSDQNKEMTLNIGINNINPDMIIINPDANNISSDIDKIDSDISNSITDMNNINSDINDCKSVLGGCLMSADSDDNCLCAQIKATVDNRYDDILIPNENINSNNIQPNLQPLKPTTVINEAVNKGCESCECQSNGFGATNANRSNGKQNLTKAICRSQNNMDSAIPEIEYKIDGSIKLKDTFDSDIEIFANVNSDSKINKNVQYESNFVPFNSCKAVLGKCIVSGNGTISEECLCAKMLVDDQQVNAEEVDEITPQPINRGFKL